MDKTLTEVFGEFTYSQKLTYDELLSHEQELMENLDHIFLECGAEYLDFTPLGDILKLQCGFENHDIPLFQTIAKKIAEILPARVRGRMLCIEKNLASYHLFWLKKDQWQEEDISIPSSAPEHVRVHIV